MSDQNEQPKSDPPSTGVVIPFVTGAANGAYRPPSPLPKEPSATSEHDAWTGVVIKLLDERFRKLDKKVWLAVAIGASQLAVDLYEMLKGLR